MKSKLVRHEKFLVRRRFLVEIVVHKVSTDNRYADNLKWSLICVDRSANRRVLMDNHHPKGPHTHIDDLEVPYEYHGIDQLVADFRNLIMEHMGVQI